MAKEIWNEGRVVGYSAYEMYVKSALARGVTPATEQQWLASSLAMGSSLLLKVNMSDPTTHVFDVELPANSKLRAANTIVASLFYGQAEFNATSPWGHAVSRYFQGPENSPTSHPVGEVTQYDSFDDGWSAEEVDAEYWELNTQAYCNIIDGCIYQPGTWTEVSSSAPCADMRPDLTELPHVRIRYKQSGLITQPTILLTGFTDSAVLAGIIGVQGSVNTDTPEDGDFLGPAVFPWSAKIIFAVPTAATGTLASKYDTPRIESAIESDLKNASYSEWHYIEMYPAIYGETGFHTDPQGELTHYDWEPVVSTGDPYGLIDLHDTCGGISTYEVSASAPGYIGQRSRRQIGGYASENTGYVISPVDKPGQTEGAFKYPRPDAEPIVDVQMVGINVATESRTSELLAVSGKFRMRGRVPVALVHGGPNPPDSGITPESGDIVISNAPHMPTLQITAFRTGYETDLDIAGGASPVGQQLAVVLRDGKVVAFDEICEGQMVQININGTTASYIKSPIAPDNIPIAGWTDSIEDRRLHYLGVATNASQIVSGSTTPPVINGETYTDLQPYDTVKTEITVSDAVISVCTFVWSDEQTPGTFVWRNLYAWQLVDSSSQLSGPCQYIDQYFQWSGAYWRCLGPIAASSGFYTYPHYCIESKHAVNARNTWPLRVLGESSTPVNVGALNSPTIRGVRIPASKLNDGDVVRYDGVCYVVSCGVWGLLPEMCNGHLYIKVWSEYIGSPVRFTWRLRWRIPADKSLEELLS